jgi:transcriptional regulator with XRE-family HTH domain
MQRFTDAIYTWRVTYRMTQEQAAELAGVSAKQWARWERDEARPNEDHYNTVNYLISFPPPWLEREGSPGELPDAPEGVVVPPEDSPF